MIHLSIIFKCKTEILSLQVGATTISITTISRMTLSVMGYFTTLRIIDKIDIAIILSVTFYIWLCWVSVVTLNVIMLRVVAPFHAPYFS